MSTVTPLSRLELRLQVVESALVLGLRRFDEKVLGVHVVGHEGLGVSPGNDRESAVEKMDDASGPENSLEVQWIRQGVAVGSIHVFVIDETLDEPHVQTGHRDDSILALDDTRALRRDPCDVSEVSNPRPYVVGESLDRHLGPRRYYLVAPFNRIMRIARAGSSLDSNPAPRAATDPCRRKCQGDSRVTIVRGERVVRLAVPPRSRPAPCRNPS